MMRKTLFEILLLTVFSVCMLAITINIQSVKASNTATADLSLIISPSAPVVTVNSTFVFTASVTGGTPPYQYAWTLTDSIQEPVAYGTASPWNCSIPYWTYVGTGRVTLGVTDSHGNLNYTSEVVTIVAISVSVSPTSATLDVGQSQVFKSSILGGARPISYQWYLDGSSVSSSTGTSWKYTPPSAGSHTVYVKVKDSIGNTAESNNVSVTVNPALSVTISPRSATLDVGQSQLFSSSVSGGTSPYGYKWYLNGNTVVGATNNSWTFTPVSAGLYTVFLNVTDSLNVKFESNTSNVKVNSELVAPTVTATPSAVDQGQSAMLSNSTAISTGTSPYVYEWLSKAPSASSYSPISGETSFNCTFSTTTSTETGLWSFALRVIDGCGAVVNSTTTTVTVYFSVTFAQVGLPAGTFWNATFNGVTKSSNASQIVFITIAPGNYSWNIGTPITGGIGIRYVASLQSGSMNATTHTVQSITFTNQYYLTVSSVYDTATGEGWYYAGSVASFNITDPIVLGSSGTRYVLTGWSSSDMRGYNGTDVSHFVTMNNSITETANWKTQYYITFAQSGVGSDFAGGVMAIDDMNHTQAGYSSWYDCGFSVVFRFYSPLTVNSGKMYIFADANASSPLNVTAAQTVAGTFETQYYLTVDTSPSGVKAPTGEGWYDAGTFASIYTDQYVEIVSSSSRYRFENWTTTDLSNITIASSHSTTVLMDKAETVTANYVTQYNVTFYQSGVGSDFSGTVVILYPSGGIPGGVNYTRNTLPASLWCDSGSLLIFTFQSALVVPPGAKQYVWASTSGLSTSQVGSITVAVSGSVAGKYVTKVHDVEVTSIVPDRTVIFRGYTAKITVTVVNKGNFSETVSVNLYYNITANEIVGTQNITLGLGERSTLSFAWNTLGVRYCPNYTLTTVATIPTGDFTLTDNTLSLGHLKITILGDTNGDGKINILDVVMATSIYGSYRGSPNWNPLCDLNGDDHIDILDIVAITAAYGDRVY
jgi:hypothetical protein